MKLQILALTLLLPISSHAADKTESTRTRYAAVNKMVPRATAVKRDLQGYSLEGGELTAYFQKSVPIKITAKHYGETGRTTDELYFWQGRLFFVLETRENYNHPFSAFFDTPVKVAARRQNRFYFQNGKLWRWGNDDRKIIENGADFKEQEKYQLQFARAMLAGVRSKTEIIEAPKDSGIH